MKEFVWEKYNKINFVDDNNLFVGIDMKPQKGLYSAPVFVQYGYWFSKSYKGTKLLNYSDLKDEFNLENYNFDKHFISQTNDFQTIIDGNEYVCSQTIFRLLKPNDDKPIFLYLRCLSIEGYYSEGFDFGKFDNEKTLEKYNEGDLDLSEVRDYGKKIEGFDLYKSGDI